MSKKKRYTITAALPYANGPLHIGHIAGCYLPADIFTRYLREKNEEVFFICGSDEHGVPITIRAKKENISYQEAVDKYHELMKKTFHDFGIAFDFYGRTSSDIHHKTSSDIFKKIYNEGGFTEENTQQYFDPEAKQFLADRYITGTCPICGNTNAYGDQCEKCGSTLNATDLINPHSTLSGATPELRDTKNWFLPLDELQKKYIDEYIAKHATDWKPNVLGQCKSWLNEGLKPRAMTRDLDWGVKVPLENAEGKVLYVWFDAPIGYISATKEYFETLYKTNIESTESVLTDAELQSLTKNEIHDNDWKKWWIKNDDVEQKLFHFIGKDNIVFHCIIFPAMLFSYNENSEEKFLIPDNVPANEFLNLEGEKISTSRNHAVWLHEYLQDFPNRTDELRYYLTAIAPETGDSDFIWKNFQLSVNSELVAIVGNFVNRVAVLLHKFYEGKIPEYDPIEESEFITVGAKLFKNFEEKKKLIENHIENFHFRDAQNELINLFRNGNKFLAEKEPWHIIKTNTMLTAIVMYTMANYCLWLGILSKIFLPKASKKIQKIFNISEEDYKFSDNVNSNLLKGGHLINAAEYLYTNIEDAEIEKQVEKLKTQKNSVAEEKKPVEKETIISEIKSEIQYEDFAKLDIRVATILEAEKVPKADRLLKLLLDTGTDKRTVVSGIAEHFTAEEIIGKQVLILVNLAPRKMKGIESNGMILMAEENGKLVFVSPQKNIANGSKVS